MHKAENSLVVEIIYVENYINTKNKQTITK